MTVVLFHHPRISVPQVLCHHQKRHSIHDGKACPSVPKTMETDRRNDLGVLASFVHRPELMRFLP